MFHRMSLWSPDAFLRRTMHLISPLFSRLAVVIWAAAMMFSAVFVWQHMTELADPFRYASAGQSALLMAVLLVVLKGVHEFGHAYGCRYFGGSVPEMGLFFIVGTPCAYVDASASWGFPQRNRRIIVAMAGMYFESIAAMGALALWSLSGPGLVKAAAHQALMLATVVTIGFNINPLMKFDGYYALADVLGMPELRNDSIYEWKRCVKRILYGLRTPSIAKTSRESFGLAFFGCCLAIYKITVIVGISIMITGIPVIGLPVGLVFFVSFFWQMLGKYVRYTMTSNELDSCRARGLAVAAVGFFGGIGFLFYVPSPGMTAAYGVVHHEFRQTLHANADGVLQSVSVDQGQQVRSGQRICQLTSEQMTAEAGRLNGELAESELMVRSTMTEEPAEYQLAVHRLTQVRSRQQELQAELRALAPVALVDGQVLLQPVLRVPGSWVRKGDALAVVGHGRRIVDAIINEEEAVAGLPEAGDEVQVWLEAGGGQLLQGVLIDIAPAARRSNYEESLTSIAGGPVEVHPETDKSDLAWFSLRILLMEEPEGFVCDGVRAVVKLDVERPPIGFSVYRSCCRLRDSFLMAK